MRQLIPFSVCLALSLSVGLAAPGDPQPGDPGTPDKWVDRGETWVWATGSAPANLVNAREDALKDAMRHCIEAAGLKKIYSQTQAEDAQLIVDRIYMENEGYVTDLQELDHLANDGGLYKIRVKARVVPSGDIEKDAMALRTLIMKQKDRPRMVVVGGSEGVPFREEERTIIRGMLVQRHFDTLYEANLDANRRREADAMACKDPKAAAHIMAEQNADYYVVAAGNITQGPPQDIATGIKATTYHATVTVSVFARDTSRLSTSTISQLDSNYSTDPDVQEVKRHLLQQTLRDAMQKALGGVVKDWWRTDTQYVELLFVKYPFDKVTSAAENLRKIENVTRVIISNTDAEGRAHVRVETQLSAADLGGLLIRIDPALVVSSSSAYQLTLDGSGVEAGWHLSDFMKRLLGWIAAGAVAFVAMILGIGAWIRHRAGGAVSSTSGISSPRTSNAADDDGPAQ